MSQISKAVHPCLGKGLFHPHYQPCSGKGPFVLELEKSLNPYQPCTLKLQQLDIGYYLSYPRKISIPTLNGCFYSQVPSWATVIPWDCHSLWLCGGILLLSDNILKYCDTSFGTLNRIQTEIIDLLSQVERSYKIRCLISLLICMNVVMMELSHSENRTPQFCPILGCPIWLR